MYSLSPVCSSLKYDMAMCLWGFFVLFCFNFAWWFLILSVTNLGIFFVHYLFRYFFLFSFFFLMDPESAYIGLWMLLQCFILLVAGLVFLHSFILTSFQFEFFYLPISKLSDSLSAALSLLTIPEKHSSVLLLFFFSSIYIWFFPITLISVLKIYM